MPQGLPYIDQNGLYYRTFGPGLGQLSPLLGMGSSLAGYMGHGNIANMLGMANSFIGKYGNYFPQGLGAFGSQGNGWGQPQPSGTGPFIGSPGTPFMGSPGFGGYSGYGSHYYPTPPTQSTGFGGFLHSLFGGPVQQPGYYGGPPPGYF